MMHQQPAKPDRTCRAFSLIELLVVVAVIAVLLSILMPALGTARRQARIVRAHSDLRQICIALESYALEHRDRVPPTRQSCSDNVQYRLPVELARSHYFAESRSLNPQSEFFDEFDRAHTYRYRAPGAVWQNGQFFDFPDQPWMPRARLWVPSDFPQCRETEGNYYADRSNDEPCPVTYAVWSVGPDPQAEKFPRVPSSPDVIDEARFPLPRELWLEGANDVGLITHFRTRTGLLLSSP